MTQQWFYATGGEQRGPVNSATLKQLALSGQLDSADLVWHEGMASWIAASQVKGLFPHSDVQRSTPPPLTMPALPKNPASASQSTSESVTSTKPAGAFPPSPPIVDTYAQEAFQRIVNSSILRRIPGGLFTAVALTIVGIGNSLVGFLVSFWASSHSPNMDFGQILAKAARDPNYIILNEPFYYLFQLTATVLVLLGIPCLVVGILACVVQLNANGLTASAFPRVLLRRADLSDAAIARAARMVSAPAIAVMIYSAIGIAISAVMCFVGFVRIFTATSDATPAFMLCGNWLSLISNSTTVLGGLAMKRMQSYRLAMAANILIMLPISTFCLIGIPIGIWGLIVLSRQPVKEAFHSLAHDSSAASFSPYQAS